MPARTTNPCGGIRWGEIRTASATNLFGRRPDYPMVYDRKLTMLGLALLAATILLYYATEEWRTAAYVTGVAMIGVFLFSFIRFNLKYVGKSGRR